MLLNERPTIEEWRVIPGFSDYEASSWGRVRRATPYRSTAVGYILKPERQRGGHLLVRLSVKQAQPKAMAIHRLVALTFVGPPPSPRHLVAHDDGVPSHNWPSNLIWKTHKQNTADRARHGTDQVGERNPNLRLTDEEVRLIRARYHVGGETKAALGRLFGVADVHVGKIVKGQMRTTAGGYL